MLVQGASRLASSIGISPLVIGLTVVAFGTSSPELAVSIKAALSNQANIAVGNNIFNVLFILGLSALIVQLAVSQRLVRFDVPLMIALSVFVLFFSLDGKFGRIDGLILTAGLACYVLFLIIQSRREHLKMIKEFRYAQQRRSMVFDGWHRRLWRLAEESNEKYRGKQLAPSDQHKVSILKPFMYLPVEWSYTRDSS